MKERLNKLLALVMTFMMLFSSLPVDTLAEAMNSLVDGADNVSEGMQTFANMGALPEDEETFVNANGVISLPCYEYDGGKKDTILGYGTYVIPKASSKGDSNVRSSLWDRHPATYPQIEGYSPLLQWPANYHESNGGWDNAFVYSSSGSNVHGMVSFYWNGDKINPAFYSYGRVGQNTDDWVELSWDEFKGYLNTLYLPYHAGSPESSSTYTDTFVSDERTVSTKQVDCNTYLIMPSVEEKPDFQFVGWLDNATNQVWETGAAYRQPTSDVIFTAQWQPNDDHVMIDPNGGSFTYEGYHGITTPISVTVEVAKAILADNSNSVSRDGNRFKAWESVTRNSDGTLTTKRTNTAAAGQTIRAIWSTVTLTYDLNEANSGTAPAAWTGVPGTTIKLPDVANAQKDDYKFVGWATTPNANRAIIDGDDKALPIVYYPGDSFTVEEDRTLYAVWAPTTQGNTMAAYVQFAIYQYIDQKPYEPQAHTETYAVIRKDDIECNPLDYFYNLISIYNDSGRIVANIRSEKLPSTQEAIEAYNKEFQTNYSANDYDVIWYVIKYQKKVNSAGGATQDSSYAFYVDGYLRSKNKVTLTYDLNLKGAATLAEVWGTPPDGTTQAPGKINVYAYKDGKEPLGRNNYTFLGWAVNNPDATEPDYSYTNDINLGEYDLQQNTTLYAVWKRNYSDRLDITVSKKWEDENGNVITDETQLANLSATFDLWRSYNGQTVPEYVESLTSVGGADVVFREHSVYYDENTPYTYEVREASATEGYTLVGSVVNDTPENSGLNLHFTATNKKAAKTYELAVKKLVVDGAFFPTGSQETFTVTISGEGIADWTPKSGDTIKGVNETAWSKSNSTLTITMGSETCVTLSGLPAGEYTISEVAASGNNLSDFDTRTDVDYFTTGSNTLFNNQQDAAAHAAAYGQKGTSRTVKLGESDDLLGVLLANAINASENHASFQKTVDNVDQNDKNDTFVFELVDSNSNAFTNVQDITGEGLVSIERIWNQWNNIYEKGKIRITVKQNETVNIGHLPENGTYTLTEIGYYEGGTGDMIAIGSDDSKYAVPQSMTLTLGGKITFTNTYKAEPVPETTSVTVKKVWEDGDNAGGFRPESVTVRLKATAGDRAVTLPDGTSTDVTLTTSNADADNNNTWTYTWTDLPKYENGQEISYTVVELTGTGDSLTELATGATLSTGKYIQNNNPVSYTVSYNGLTVTNTLNDLDEEEPAKNTSSGTEFVKLQAPNPAYPATTSAMVPLGGKITYTISYFNHTNKKQTVTVTDTLADCLTYVDSTLTPEGEITQEGQNLTWKISDVAPLTHGTISVTVTVNSVPQNNVVHNKASVTIDGKTSYAENDTTIYAPALTIEKTIQNYEKNKNYTVGDKLQYTVTVNNTGNVDLYHVSLTDTLVDSSVITGKIDEADVEDLNDFALNVGQAATFTYTYEVTADDLGADGELGKIENKATATAKDPTGGEKDIEVSDEKDVPTKMKLVITVNDKTTSYTGSEQEGYELPESLPNNANEEGYSVTGLAQGNTVAVSYTPSSGTDVGTHDNGFFVGNVTVTDGEENDVTDLYEITTETGKLIITNAPIVPEKKHTNNTVPKLGETVTYQIVLENTSDKAVTDVTVTDPTATSLAQPTNSEYTLSEDGKTASGITVPAKSTVTITANYTITEADIIAGEHKNTATVSTPDGWKKDVLDTVKTDDPDPALVVNKSVKSAVKADGTTAATKPYTTGDVITYQVTVQNIGNLTITGIKLTDAIKNLTDEEAHDLSITENGKIGENSNVDPANFTLKAGKDRNGETATFTYTYTVTVDDLGKDGEAGKLTNQASVSAPNPDPNPDPDKKDLEEKSEEVEVPTQTVITVTKEWVDDSNAGNKRPASLTIKLMNGDDVAASETISDTKSQNEQTVKFVVPALEDGKYSVEEPLDSESGYTSVITGSAASGFTITNSLKEGEETKPEKTKTDKTEYVTINGETTQMVAVDGFITYNITYYNHLTTRQTITITDVLDSKVDFEEASNDGTYEPSTRTVTWKISDVAPLAGGSVTLKVKVNDTAVPKDDNGKPTGGNPSINNTAEVEIGNDYSVDSNSDSTPVYNPALEVNKAISSGLDADGKSVGDPYKHIYTVGEKINYHVTIKNTGNVKLTGISLSDSLEDIINISGNINSDTSVNPSSFDLEVGQSATFTYSYIVEKDDLGDNGSLGEIKNTAKATAKDPTDPTDPTKTVEDEDSKNVLTKIKLTITANDAVYDYDGEPHGANEEDPYKVEGLREDDVLTGVTVTGEETNAAYYEDWLVPESDVTQGGVVVKRGNEDVTGEYEIFYVAGNLHIKADRPIEAEKSADDFEDTREALLDEKITYIIKVTNITNQTITNVTVEDDNATIIEGNGYKLQEGKALIDTLGVDQTVEVKAERTVTEADIMEGEIKNTAYVSANGVDKFPTNPVTITTADPNPSLSVEKKIVNEKAPYTTGDKITYQVTVKNTGNLTIENISLTDAIKNAAETTGRSLPIGNGTIGENSNVDPASFTLKAGKDGNGETATFTYTYKVQHNDTVDDLGENGTAGRLTNTATATAKVTIPDPNNPETNKEKEITETGTTDTTTDTVITVTKKWVDDSNAARPDTITIKLMNDEEAASETISDTKSQDEQTVKFVVPALESGVYSVEEQLDSESGYTPVITGSAASGFTITNVLSNPKKEITAITAINGTTLTYDGKLVKVGETITYEITYYNTTSEDATVTVTDKLPAGVELVGATGSYDYDEAANKVIWKIENVPAASQGKVSLTVKVTEDAIPKDKNGYPTTAKPTVANTANVQIGDSDGQETAPATVEIYNPALKVEKSAEGQDGANTQYKYGDKIKYTVTVSNIGNVDLSGIKLTDSLVDSRNITGTMNGASVENVENFALEAGQSATFTYIYTVTAADLGANGQNGTVYNTATASAPDPEVPGKTVEDEDKEDVDTVERNPQLAIVKTALGIDQGDGTYKNDTPYKVGDVITYQVVVSNEGNVPYKNVTLSDSLVNDALSGSIPKADGTKEAVTSTTDFTLGVGEKATFTYTYTVTAKDVANGSENLANGGKNFTQNGTLTNTATVNGTPEDSDKSEEKSDEKDVKLEPNSRKIKVTKKWLDGNGNTLAQHPESAVVIVSNEVDFEEELIDFEKELMISTPVDGNASWSANLYVPKYAEDGNAYTYAVSERDEKGGKITVGEKTYTVEYEASKDNSSFTVTNTRGDDEPTQPTKTATMIDTVEIETSDGKTKKVPVGGTIEYTIEYSNNTNKIAAVTVEDTLPQGVTYTENSTKVNDTAADDPTPDANGSLTWTISDVAPYAEGTLTFRVTVNNPFDGEKVTKNEASVTIGGSSQTATSDEVPVYNPMLKVEKKALGLVTTDKNGNETVVERDRYVVGDTVRYEVTVTNIGNTDIDSVTVHDAIKANGTKGTDYPVDLNGVLKPKGTATVTYTHTFTSDDVTVEGENRVVKNVASASGTTPEGEKVPESDEDEETVKIGDKYKAEITVKDKEVEYTGKEQSGYTVPTDDKLDNVKTAAAEGEERYTVTGLENGDKLIVTYTPSKGTYVGEYTNGAFDDASVKVVDKDGNDVTGQYNVTQNRGKLTITGNPVEPAKDYEKEIKDNAAALLGETITYTIAVKNVYQTALTDVVVRDDNATIIAGEGYTVQDGKALIATLGVGEIVYVKAQRAVTEDDIKTDKITNTAYVKVNNKEYPTNPVEIKTDDPTPKLKVEKTVTSTPKDGVAYKLGEVISYQVVVTNTGNVTLTNIKVEDKIGETVNLNETIEKLEPAQSKTFPYTYTVTEADLGAKGQNGTVHNVATATAPDPTDHPDDPDKTVTEKDEEDTPTDPADPSLEVEKTVLGIESGDGYTKKDVYTVGDVITFSVSVKNTGNVTVKDIRLTDAISNAQGAKDLKIGEGELTDGQVVDPAAFTLAPEAEAAFTYTYTVTVDDLGSDGTLGRLTNKAKAGGTPNVPTDPDDPDDPDPTEDEDEKTVDTAIKLPIAANDNTVDYDGQPHGENGYTYDENALEDGHTLTSVTIEGEKTDVGRYPDELKPNGFEVTDGSGNNVTDHYYPIYTNGTLTIQTPNVEVTKTADKKTVRPDGILTYTVTVTNKDEKNTGLVAAAKGVTVKENLPDNASLVESSATQGKFDARTGVWTVGDIAANAEATLTLRMKVSADALNGDKVKNSVVATVPNDDPNDPDDPEDDTETDVRYPILTVAKTIMQPSRNADGEYVVREGDTVRYEIKVTNIGQGDANTIVLKDALPDGLRLTKLSTSNARNVNGEVVWTIPSLKAGGYAVLSVYAVVTDKSITGRIDRNVARITGENGEDIPEDEQPTGESEEITVRNPRLEVEKSVDNTVVYSGKSVHYTIKVTNTGAATAYQVWMKDDLPAGLRRESEKLNGSIWSNQKGLYKISSLAPGESVTIVIKATVTAAIGSVVAPNVAIITGENGKDIPEDEQPKGESEEVESVGVKVFFIDWNGRIIAIREVPYGGSAVPPADPTRIGWDFSYWDGVWKNVTQNQYVYARYTPRTPHDANTPISGDHYGIILDADIPLAGGYMSTVGDCFD